MSWTGGEKFRAVLSLVLAGYLVLNVVQGDWVWVALIAGVIALNVWTLTKNARRVDTPADRRPGADSP
jgi:ABC-type iron transport system FetAB permease component